MPCDTLPTGIAEIDSPGDGGYSSKDPSALPQERTAPMNQPPFDDGLRPEGSSPDGQSPEPADGQQSDSPSDSDSAGSEPRSEQGGLKPPPSALSDASPGAEAIGPVAGHPTDGEEAAAPNLTSPPPADSGIWLADDDFVEADRKAPQLPSAPPGPGLPESLLWTGGVLGVQVIASIIVAIVIAIGLVVLAMSRGGGSSAGPSPGELQQAITSIQSEHLGLLLSGTQALLVMGVIIAARLRIGRDTLRRLSFHQLSFGHSVAILALILPLGIVSSQMYVAFEKLIWEPLVNLAPALRSLDDMNTMTQMGELTASMPLPLLLLAIALAPAIAEELVFRGVIGRGLTARWGVVWGVLLTSVLFAIVHMHPVHAAGVFLLGLGMHLVYLATRSFWAPMLVHLTNNSLAATVAKMPVDPDAAALASEQPQHPLIILAAVLLVAAIAWYFWKSRIEYRLPDGSSWDPGYFTVETPPEDSAATRFQHSAGTLPVALIMLAMAHFVIMLSTFSPVATP